MTLRTPRRRISPRAKRRYRAIREFFRRALGSPSQQDIKINSSIAVNVTDLKHKIVGIEHQLNEVNRHCRDLAGLESDFRRDTENLVPRERKHAVADSDRPSSSSEKKTFSGTKVLYKHSDNSCSKSNESSYACVFENNDTTRTTPQRYMSSEETEAHYTKVKNRKNIFNKKVYRLDGCDVHECSSEPQEHKTQSTYDNNSTMYSTSSFRSLGEGRGARARDVATGSGRPHRRRERPRRRRDRAPDPTPPSPPQVRTKRHQDHHDITLDSPVLYEDRHVKSQRSKTKHIDHDFISDLINRQYKPVKLFGRRESDMSQFSAPVCRDQEYPAREEIRGGSELCSCCREVPAARRSRYVRSRDLTDMRSICDTRLYSSKRHARPDPRRRQCLDVYNDSDLYDLIPVKEKSSPKSRRKFFEDNEIPYYYYREVPPSPRTMRPRLNLKAQYYDEYEEYPAHVRLPHRRPASRVRRQPDLVETYDTDLTSDIQHHTIRKDKHKAHKTIKVQNATQIHQDMGTMSTLPYSYANERNNVTMPNESNLNKTQDTDLTVDKTDKALCEIKDILQNFLHEIKKETTPSQCDKSDITAAKITEKQTSELQDSTKMKAGQIPNSTSFNYSPAPCINSPYVPPFANPCCYPMMPVCPMNCMQSSYVMPTGSFPCHGCTSTKEAACPDCSKNRKDAANETFDSTQKSNETEELIKEIYKYVAQSPNANHKNHHGSHPSSRRKEGGGPQVKVLTSRSAGGSTARAVRHDANVGTPALKCFSKSCEAIRSRLATTDTSYTNGTHSDTILEKLSLEPTQSDTELSTVSLSVEKSKRSKLTRVLRKFGLLVKKKKDSLEELDESESSIEVDVKRRQPPFRQDIASYMMHGQEYYDPRTQPPYPPPNIASYPYSPNMYGPPAPYPPYAAGAGGSHTGVHAGPSQPVHTVYSPHRVHEDTIHEHAPTPPQPQHYGHAPSAPPYPHGYDPHYGHASPQVPLCLKEVEVKSTGTQSERKMSFFHKIVKNPPPRVNRWQDSPRTQTTQTQMKGTKQSKGLFSGFKNLRDEINSDPVKFQLKTQAELANGDYKMRNAMLKKLFHKRNPFSPRNMFMKTLLGKDEISYGRPNFKQIRPKLFV